MTTIYLNSSSSNDQYNEHQFFSPSDQHHEHQFLSPNSQAPSSSNPLTCHLFFNPITTHDQDGVFNRESHPSQNEDDSFGSQAYDDHRVESQDERVTDTGGLKFSLWKRETYDHMNDDNQLKWMSSKMRVMFKMKKTDPPTLNTLPSTAKDLKLEDHRDHKEPTTSPMDESATYSNTINITCSNNIPIRVCSDCNTTKTPLWRSGPQGPKSLCNACGIRQRKARKAMAMAAAAAVETDECVFSDKPTSLKATKVLHKKQNNGIFTKYKKKQSPARKNRVEELLVRLSKSLAFHRVFPQDEKEAAILLMALSCGYVHQ
ncbi:putative transcription factor C2C2-GATA family [Helianthus anomalus]